MRKKWLDIQDGFVARMQDDATATEQVHVFDGASIEAVNAALAAHRPLLVRGEPGTGKSQLACAAAFAMGRPCLTHVVDNRTTAHDLLWTFDAVARLAEAQLAGAMRMSAEEARNRLQVARFVTPGPLWWALDWRSATEQAERVEAEVPKVPNGWQAGDGAVILIDEIDKADSDVPNGLLEVLGQGSFLPLGCRKSVNVTGEMPLVVITTNEERSLPDAFVRRCLVLHLELPSDRAGLENLFVRRGEAHFPNASKKVRQRAAEQVVEDREALRKRNLPPPGQAEYLDLVRALTKRKSTEADQLAWLAVIKDFVLQKQPTKT